MRSPTQSLLRPMLATLALSHLAAGQTTTEEPQLQLSTDPTFHFDMMAPFGMAISGGADVGPMLGAAKHIIAGNMSSFTEQFHLLANATKAQAEDPENAYDPVNVRDTWFSAANYFRKADNYLHGDWDDPRIDALWEEQTKAFDKGMAALPVPGRRVEIPVPEYNFTVEAMWFGASKDKVKAPTLMVGNGFDAAPEDSYHVYCAPALARGWNCITYEGPGQPGVRRHQDIGFIPEWERVATPVVDYLMREHADVIDTGRLVLLGNSLGAFLASRAAAYESRFSALVLIDGMWEFYPVYEQSVPPEALAMYNAGNRTEFDEAIFAYRASEDTPTSAAWGIDQALWAFKTHSPSEMFDKAKEYTVKDFIDRIKVPVFVGDGEFETLFKGQPPKVKDALGDKATLHYFAGVSGYHCQVGAYQELARAIFAWLNKTLGTAS